MRISALLILCLLLTQACNQGKDTSPAEGQENHPVLDTTPRVTGIGGIFFKSTDRDTLKNWYAHNLGLSVDTYGSPFEFRNANDPDEVNYLNWDAFPDSTDYFDPSEKEFMINYRVYNLRALVEKFEANGVVVLDSISEYEYGKFVHIMDPEGNKIELWEPVDSVLSAFGRKSTK